MRIEEFELPVHWMVAMVNADDTGLNDAECRAMNAFIDDNLERFETFHCLGPKDEDWQPYFMRYHDAHPYGVLACDVTTVCFDVGSVKGEK